MVKLDISTPTLHVPRGHPKGSALPLSCQLKGQRLLRGHATRSLPSASRVEVLLPRTCTGEALQVLLIL
eukprot:3979280-Prymnesium_polylepis.2